MRMKYFTRGMGIGFIIASMIFMIAFAFYRPKMSEEQIRTEAAKLGMIDPSLPSGLMSDQESDSKSEATDDKEADTKESDTKESEEQESNDADASANPDAEETPSNDADPSANPDAEETPSYDGETSVTNVDPKDAHDAPRSDTNESIAFSIGAGETSDTVGSDLENKGLVNSGSEFDSYLENNGYDNRIQPGNYDIPKSASYDEIARIITKQN